MSPQEKAQELVDKFKEYVNGYVGSSMLTNTEYPEQVLSQAKKAAKICADEVISEIPMYTGNLNAQWKFWDDVKLSINDAT